MTEAYALEKVEELLPPDGAYRGSWSGYEVRFKVGGGQYKAKTKDGVRGLNVPCTVTVAGGIVRVDAGRFPTD